MTTGLRRFYGHNDLHFITGSCYGRRPELGDPGRRDLFLEILEQARCKYRFVVHGYVVMPEHFHLLITEPELGDPSVIMKVVKERFSRQLNKMQRKAIGQPEMGPGAPVPVWQRRFYDFNVWSERKRIEKLRYMHRNPVKRGLVCQPEDWKWSSFRAYMFKEGGLVRVGFQEWELKIHSLPVQSFGK